MPYYEITENEILSHELRDKPGHHNAGGGEHHHHDHDHSHEGGRGMDAHSMDKHVKMVEAIQDCDVLLVHGMGRGAQLSMQQAGIKALQVDFIEIEPAVQALMKGEIDRHVYEQLCGEHKH